MKNLFVILPEEKNGDYHAASAKYKRLKITKRSQGFHELADFFHYREHLCQRKTYSAANPKRLLSYIFGDLLCKYGTSYLRIMGWSIIIITTCAILFFASDSLESPHDHSSGTFITAVYFSLISFTTLGYGDYFAIGNMRFIAGLESLIGMALISLFIIIAARNILRD